MSNFQNQLKQKWHSGSIIIKLIMIHVVVFLLTASLRIFPQLFNANFTRLDYKWLFLSSDLKETLFKPWTILTYGFLEGNIISLLFSMLWLYWIGNMLIEFIGARKTLPIYLFGILFGGIFFLLMTAILTTYTQLQLGNALKIANNNVGLMAILWATVTLFPKRKIGLIFLGMVPLLYLAIGFTVIEIFSTNNVSIFSTIGGSLAGFLYVKLYQKGINLSKPFNQILDWFATSLKPTPKARSNFKVKKGGKTTATTIKSNKNEQQQVDEILDKINRYGYESLSRKEKEFLFKQSQKN